MATSNIKNNFNIRDHNGTTAGLQLAGVLVTATAAELNAMDGVTSSAAELNILDGVTATAAELNVMAGNLATTAEINRACDDSTRVVNVTTTPLVVTLAAHDKKFVTLNKADGAAVTLPAAAGTGAEYKFFIGTAITSNTTTIKVANASDVMMGKALVISDDTANAIGFAAGASDDTITLDGSTTGGLKGDRIIIRDVATNLFHVELVLSATGTEATPFSATV